MPLVMGAQSAPRKERKRKQAANRRQGGEDDRAHAQAAGGRDGRLEVLTLSEVSLDEIDQDDGIVDHNAAKREDS